MARPIAALLLVIWLLWPPLASAQLAVHDLVNDLVYAQSILEVAQSLALINLAIRDLAPLSQLGDALAVAADLEAIITDVNQIAERVSGRRGLWRSAGVMPTTMAAFGELRRALSQICLTTSADGLEAQSILLRVTALLGRLTQLIRNLSSILGTVAGLQAANAVMSQLSGQMATLTAAVTAANEPILCNAWRQQVQEQALEQLQRQMLQDYGVWPNP